MSRQWLPSSDYFKVPRWWKRVCPTRARRGESSVRFASWPVQFHRNVKLPDDAGALKAKFKEISERGASPRLQLLSPAAGDTQRSEIANVRSNTEHSAHTTLRSAKHTQDGWGGFSWPAARVRPPPRLDVDFGRNGIGTGQPSQNDSSTERCSGRFGVKRGGQCPASRCARRASASPGGFPRREVSSLWLRWGPRPRAAHPPPTPGCRSPRSTLIPTITPAFRPQAFKNRL